MTMFTTLIALTILSAVAHIVADYKQQWSWTYVFKPFTLLLIITLVALYADMTIIPVRYVLLGLVLSLIGDIFLMLRPQKFVLGLVSFLLAHLSYIAAFSQWHYLNGLSISDVFHGFLPWVFLLIAVLYLGFMWRDLGKLKIAVVCYVSAIVSMVILAFSLVLGGDVEWNSAVGLLAIGSVLFALSDATLGYRKFKLDFKHAQTCIMSTYFSAQLLFALACVVLSSSSTS